MRLVTIEGGGEALSPFDSLRLGDCQLLSKLNPSTLLLVRLCNKETTRCAVLRTISTRAFNLGSTSFKFYLSLFNHIVILLKLFWLGQFKALPDCEFALLRIHKDIKSDFFCLG